MNKEDDYKDYIRYKRWAEQEEQKTFHLGIIEPKAKPKPESVLIPIHYVWAAGAGAIVLLIAAWPFTLLGFFIGLFVRLKWWK